MPPLLAPRSLQVSRSLKALREFGWEVTVITSKCTTPIPGLPEDEALSDWYNRSYEAIRLPYGEQDAKIETGWRRFFRKGPTDVDGRWVFNATNAASLWLESHNCDAVITFAQPWFDHLVGLALKRRFGIGWLAHFSDPWIDNPYYASLPRSLRHSWARQERVVVREANAIVFTTEEICNLVMRKYPTKWHNKAFDIAHSFDPTHLPPPSAVRPKSSRLTILHAGDFYAGKRMPFGLLGAVRRLSLKRPIEHELELIFIGTIPREVHEMASSLGISHVLRIIERRPYFETLELMQDADVLLVVDAPAENNVFLPSKVADYLMFEKPILGLTPASGATARLLRRLDCIVASPTNELEITDALEKLLAAYASRSLAVSAHFSTVAREFSVAEITARLDAILLGVVVQNSPSRSRRGSRFTPEPTQT